MIWGGRGGGYRHDGNGVARDLYYAFCVSAAIEDVLFGVEQLAAAAGRRIVEEGGAQAHVHRALGGVLRLRMRSAQLYRYRHNDVSIMTVQNGGFAAGRKLAASGGGGY
jgi:hypothetical protein